MEFKSIKEEQIRIDHFLTQEISFLSREEIKKHIKEGNVLINNVITLKPSQKVLQNDNVFLKLNESIKKETTLKPWKNKKMPEILFECDDYLVINKPSGLMVHPGTGNTEKTLVNILIAHKIPLSKATTNRPGIVHRIDKNTSGVLLIAKNDKFHDYISEKFSNKEVEKTYILITDGKYKSAKGIIEVPIGRDSNNRKIMKATLINSKKAKSIFKVKESFPSNEYVEFKILTGRTHQIRVHSKFIGAPILNDPEYSKKVFDLKFGQYLHANELSFLDIEGNIKNFKAEPPIQIIQKLKELRDLK